MFKLLILFRYQHVDTEHRFLLQFFGRNYSADKACSVCKLKVFVCTCEKCFLVLKILQRLVFKLQIFLLSMLKRHLQLVGGRFVNYSPTPISHLTMTARASFSLALAPFESGQIFAHVLIPVVIFVRNASFYSIKIIAMLKMPVVFL